MKFLLKIFILIFAVSASNCYSQQKKLIEGYVFFDNLPCNNINVKNISLDNLKNYATTNELGIFHIEVKEGDTLLFSSLNYDLLKILIKNETVLTSKISIEMKKKIYELEEVIINKQNRINALSLGIINKPIKTKTPAERRLYTAGDFKPIQLLNILGGSMPFDPILNAVNGKTKKLKKELLVETKENNMSFLKDNYADYALKTLKIPEKNVFDFFYFIVNLDDTQKYIENKNDLKMKFYLCDQLINYQDFNKEKKL